MPFLYSLLFIVIIVGAGAICYAYQFNKLQHSKTKIDHAEVLIDEALREKYDVLTKADTFISKELKSDKTFFKGLDKVKKEDISNYDLDRKLTEYIANLDQIKIDHEDLANNKTFKEILSDLKKNDEKLQASKTYYNKYTSELNDLIRTFPSNIVAKMHSISINTFFDGKDMEDDIVDDFKF